MRLPRLRPDLSPLRESRDLRLIILGNFLSTLGSQATLVALPYQLYVQSHSALLVGLLGAVELGPLLASALLAGAIADRMDRRRLRLDVRETIISGKMFGVGFIGRDRTGLRMHCRVSYEEQDTASLEALDAGVGIIRIRAVRRRLAHRWILAGVP